MASPTDCAHRTTLPGGLRVVSQRVPGALSAAIGLYVLTGTRHEPPDARGATHFIEHLLFKGTERRSAHDIALAMDGVGGSLNGFTDRELTSIQARVMGRDVPLAVDLICDMVAHPAFDPEQLERERDVVYQEIKQYEDDPEEMVHDLFAQCLWPDHPLGAAAMGSEAQVRALSRDRLLDYFRERYLPANMVVAAAGEVEHERLVDLFAALPSDGRPPPADPPDPPGPAAPARRIISRPGEQVHFCLGAGAFPQTDDRSYVVSLLDRAIGTGMSSRLFQEVRENRGLVYSIGSYGAGYRDAGLFAAFASTSPDRVALVLDLVRRELDRVRSDGLEEDELARAKQQVKAGLAMATESMGFRAWRAAICEIYWGRHLPLDEILAQIEAVTPRQVAAVAGRILDARGLAWAAVGPYREEGA